MRDLNVDVLLKVVVVACSDLSLTDSSSDFLWLEDSSRSSTSVCAYLRSGYHSRTHTHSMETLIPSYGAGGCVLVRPDGHVAWTAAQDAGSDADASKSLMGVLDSLWGESMS